MSPDHTAARLAFDEARNAFADLPTDENWERRRAARDALEKAEELARVAEERAILGVHRHEEERRAPFRARSGELIAAIQPAAVAARARPTVDAFVAKAAELVAMVPALMAFVEENQKDRRELEIVSKERQEPIPDDVIEVRPGTVRRWVSNILTAFVAADPELLSSFSELPTLLHIDPLNLPNGVGDVAIRAAIGSWERPGTP